MKHQLVVDRLLDNRWLVDADDFALMHVALTDSVQTCMQKSGLTRPPEQLAESDVTDCIDRWLSTPCQLAAESDSLQCMLVLVMQPLATVDALSKHRWQPEHQHAQTKQQQ